MKLVLIGAGQRGMLYARYAYGAGHGIAAVAEPDDVRREAAGTAFGESGEGYARVSYAYSVSHIAKALERIKNFIS